MSLADDINILSTYFHKSPRFSGSSLLFRIDRLSEHEIRFMIADFQICKAE